MLLAHPAGSYGVHRYVHHEEAGKWLSALTTSWLNSAVWGKQAAAPTGGHPFQSRATCC
jgi:hypothetical protein